MSQVNRIAAALIGFGLWMCISPVPASDYVIGVIDPTRIVEQSPFAFLQRFALQPAEFLFACLGIRSI